MSNLQETANDLLESFGDMLDDLNSINRLDSAQETFMFTKVKNEYTNFKNSPAWRNIQSQLKKIKNDPNKLDEQFKLLMQAKSELIKARNYIAGIPEDGWANFGMIMSVMTVTIGITVACLLIPGASGSVFSGVAVFTSLLAPVYAYIRGYYNAYGSRDSYNGYAAIPNQQGIGSLSKQVAVAHVDKMLADTNKKLTYVIANKACNINKAAMLIADKCSDQFLEKLDNLESSFARGNERDIKNLIGSKYFKDFEKTIPSDQKKDKKDNNHSGNNPQQKKENNKAS